MPNLRHQLENCLRGRVCVVGVGHPGQGDDAFGPRLAEGLAAAGVHPVLDAGLEPERFLGRIEATGCDRVLFLDAADFGAPPGAVALFESREIAARFPQVSTHRLSLGLLARLLEADAARRVCLLAVQPETLRPATPDLPSTDASAGRSDSITRTPLSPTVQRTLEALLEILVEVLRPDPDSRASDVSELQPLVAV